MFCSCCAKKDDTSIAIPEPPDGTSGYQEDMDDAWMNEGVEDWGGYNPDEYGEEDWWEEDVQNETWEDWGGDWEGYHEGYAGEETDEAAAAAHPVLQQQEQHQTAGRELPTSEAASRPGSNVSSATIPSEPRGGGGASSAEAAPSAPKATALAKQPKASSQPEPVKVFRPLRYNVHLERKTMVSPWGIGVDLSDSNAIFLFGVSSGDDPAGRYNKTATTKLQENDFILAVNEVKPSGDVEHAVGGGSDVASPFELIRQEFKKSLAITMTVQRPHLFTVTIHRQKAESAGLDLNFDKKSNSLVITKVSAGSVQRCAPDVRPRDRIIAVNGSKGQPEQLLQALKSGSEKLVFSMARCL